jgi:hypothetical protein
MALAAGMPPGAYEIESERGGDAAVYVQRIDVAGGAARLTMPADGEIHVPESWPPDGARSTS